MKIFENDGIGNVPGLFGIEHLAFLLLGLIIIALLLLFTYKKPADIVERIIKISFWIVFILEILKIVWNLTVRENVTLDNWVPLYYCSFFIYASFLVAYTKGWAKQFGKSFLFFGQVVAGTAFLIYPSSALLIHPFLHVLSIHSLIYHALSVYVGLLIVVSGYYKPRGKDFWLYFIVLAVFSSLIYCFNLIFKTNMMFLNSPWNIEPLKILYDFSKVMYPIVLSMLQIVGSFLVSYVIYIIIARLKEHKSLKNLTKCDKKNIIV